MAISTEEMKTPLMFHRFAGSNSEGKRVAGVSDRLGHERIRGVAMNRMRQSLLYGVLVGVTMLFSMSVCAEEGWTPRPTIVQAQGERCVEPTEVMRERHFEFIEHHRDETMHQGIRTTKYSLTGCIKCHATRDKKGKYLPVNAQGQFCNSCHTYAAVSIDCFSCHATKPPAEK
jgi:hypothetical protein